MPALQLEKPVFFLQISLNLTRGDERVADSPSSDGEGVKGWFEVRLRL